MKKKTIYKCSNCGYESLKWMGKCFECNSWHSFEEVELKDKKASKNLTGGKKPIDLTKIEIDESHRLVTSIDEFNRVLGGGIVRDSVSILTARPGGGKSTLLLEIAEDIALKGYSVLYASGEESEAQIRNRAERIMETIPKGIWILSDTSMDNIISNIHDLNPDLIIVDSIQTVTLDEYPSRAGSPIQTIECANALVDIAKNKDKPRAVIMVGHMTKSDEMAGLRTLEHLVDTVLYLEGDPDEELRILMATKNRYGRTGEIGLFSMEEKGMVPIENTTDYFITKREDTAKVPGSALAIIREGSRLLMVEIESLVSQSFTPYPTRIGDSLRKDQLNTLISILEQRGNISLYDKNVVIKTTGGLRLSEQSVNLAIIMSIVSSIKKISIPNDTVFIAEVGLTGELKRVPSLEGRLRELDRMGFRKAYIGKNILKEDLKMKNLNIIELDNLGQVISHIEK